jgi:hypothetical protein
LLYLYKCSIGILQIKFTFVNFKLGCLLYYQFFINIILRGKIVSATPILEESEDSDDEAVSQVGENHHLMASN